MWQVLSMRGKDGDGAVAELMSGRWSLLPEGQGMAFKKEDTGAVMQLLHLKALGAMLISTAAIIHRSPEALNFKFKFDAPS
ncbi:hypothetical protein GW17_00052759 [Ensete ventricosum]|nr:hypothetical protein GW17_00052759 [Ensete ventricosum]RZR82984.1 hypothetical protein BHM03_00009526 [Ensete ventricosum]